MHLDVQFSCKGFLGSKHWPTKKQDALWAWFKPHMRKIFSQNIKTGTLPIWSSFIEVWRAPSLVFLLLGLIT